MVGQVRAIIGEVDWYVNTSQIYKNSAVTKLMSLLMNFPVVNAVPHPLMEIIEKCARDICPKHHANSQIIPMSNSEDNNRIRQKYHTTKSNSF